jgi:hypothetical protein
LPAVEAVREVCSIHLMLQPEPDAFPSKVANVNAEEVVRVFERGLGLSSKADDQTSDGAWPLARVHGTSFGPSFEPVAQTPPMRAITGSIRTTGPESSQFTLVSLLELEGSANVRQIGVHGRPHRPRGDGLAVIHARLIRLDQEKGETQSANVQHQTRR